MKESDPGSVLLKIKSSLESGGLFPDAPQEEPPTSEASFSVPALRDRVVVQLLRNGVVQNEQVEAAWRRWKDDASPTPDALWRVVARRPGVEAGAVFAVAASVYAFAPATSILYRSRALLRSERGRFSLRQRRRLLALGVLPVKIDETPAGPRWIFATHDPARPAVQTFLEGVDVPAYEIRYAPADDVRARLEDAFPAEAALDAQSGRDVPAPPSPSRALHEPEAPETEEKSAASERHDLETVRTFASIYEELLAGAARSGAARVRLAAATSEGSEDPLAATFEYDGSEAPRCVDLAVPPATVFSFMRRRVRSTRRGTAKGKTTHRWVAGQRHTFRMGTFPERRAWAEGRAEIVIEVVEP